LRTRFAKIEGYGTTFTVPESASGYRALHDLPEGETKTAVLSAFADALGVSRPYNRVRRVLTYCSQVCWIISCGLLAAALVVSRIRVVRSGLTILPIVDDLHQVVQSEQEEGEGSNSGRSATDIS
jgi:hypothetical protein